MRVSRGPGRGWLLLAGGLSAGAALLHLGLIASGPDWYRFFGAGEKMARMAERGSPAPALITTGIAGGLALWAAYAWSGAGLLPRLPLLRTGLVVISGVYLLRGLVLVPALLVNRGGVTAFTLWSSLIVLGHGLMHAVGSLRAWPGLGRR
jgi:hypothetical protein